MIALVAARWIHFACLFALFGSSLYWFLMGQETSRGSARSFRATILLLRVAAPVALVSGLAWLTEIIANMAGDFGDLADPATLRAFFFETQFGPVAILRLLLLTVVVAAALLLQADWPFLATMSAAGALLLLDQAWLGHAAEGGPSLDGVLMIFAYATHMFAGAAWVGGLAPLLLCLSEQRSPDLPQARARSLHLLARFSMMGIFAATAVLFSGIANAGFHDGGAVSKFFRTTYGEVLAIKLLLVAAMLALASFNRFIAMPLLRAQSSKGPPQAATLRVSIGLELGFGLLVIAAAAVLGVTPPPH